MFPRVDTPEAWESLRLDDDALRDGVSAICQRHGLASEERARFRTGSVPVYAVGERHVLKLFPPGEEAFAHTEERALSAVAGRLPVATPEPVAVGTLDGFSYVLMSRLRGRLLVDAWPELTADDRERLTGELGAALAALHAVDTSALDGLATDWGAFVRAQRETAVARQRARRLDERWVEQIPAFLDGALPADDGRRALLHTEVMREHLLVAEGARGWELTGLFDFEPAMVGAPEYEFASLGVFVSRGSGRLLRRALRAYGYAAGALDDGLSRRLLAYAIVHRYSNLRWYLERVPPPAAAATLDDLARCWWSLAEAS